jgi:hypothetical protein
MEPYGSTKFAKPNIWNRNTFISELKEKLSKTKITVANAVKFRINQEIKFLYCKKQRLNVQLYQTHLDCANRCNNVWQYIQNSIDEQLTDKMDTLYQHEDY